MRVRVETMIEPGRPDRNVAAAWTEHFVNEKERPLTLLDHGINGLATGMAAGMAAGLLALPLRSRFERAGLPVQTGGAFYFWAMRSGALFGGVSAVGIAVLQRVRGANDVVNPTLVGGSVGMLWRLWPRSLPGTAGGRVVDTRPSMLAISTTCGAMLCAAGWWAVGRDAPTAEASPRPAPQEAAAAPTGELRDPWEGGAGCQRPGDA